MKQERILQAMGNIHDELIFEAMNDRGRVRKPRMLRIAATACLIAALAIGTPYVARVVRHKGGHDVTHTDPMAHTIVVSGGAYYELLDPHDAAHRKILDERGLPDHIDESMIGRSLGAVEDTAGERMGELCVYAPTAHIATVRENGDRRPARAVYIWRDGTDCRFALFCNYLPFDDNTHWEMGELLAVYGIDEAADIAAIDVDGRRVTDRAAIEGIYETLTTARALGAQDFDREVFGTCKSEEEVSARNEAMADSMLPLRLTTTEGLVTGSLHYYPDIGYCYWALGYFCLDQALVW